jgi:hypothetical protein
MRVSRKKTVYRSVSRIGNALKSVLMNSRAFPGLGRATPRPRRERRCAGGKVRRIMGAAGSSFAMFHST